MKYQKKRLLYLFVPFFFCVFFSLLHNWQERAVLLQKYHDSEPAVQLLKNTDTFLLFLNIHKKDSLISPADLSLALEDLRKINKNDLSSNFVVSLARIRHLLGGTYPTDFAVALAQLESSLPESRQKNDLLGAFKNKQEKEFVNDTMNLAILAYFPPNQIKNDKYSVIDQASDENGFSATAFKDKDDHIIIAFRGSDETKDISDAEKILNGRMPVQFDTAWAFYKKLREQYPDFKIRATGHSLGGSLAQLLAAHTNDVLAFSCNPIGTKLLITQKFTPENIFNLIVSGDKFSSALPQAGYSVLLKPEKTDKYGDPLHPHSVLHCLIDK